MSAKRSLAILALCGIGLTFSACESTTPTAPSDGTMVLIATPTTIVINNGAGQTEGQSLVAAQVFDADGFALDGIAVLFTATAGQMASSDNTCKQNTCAQSGANCTTDLDCAPGTPTAVKTNASGIATDQLLVDLFTPSPVTVTARSATLAQSVAITVTTPTANQSPTAVIQANPQTQQVIGSPITFSGLGSTDPDGSITCYQWTVTSSVPGSNEVVQGPTQSTLTRTYGAAQNLSVELRVSDDPDASTWCVPGASSSPSMFSSKTAITSYKIVCDVSAPNANAGPDQTVFLFGGTASATLNGAGSSDADSEIVSYSWSCGNGTAPLSGVLVTCVYSTPTIFTAELTVTNDCGLTDTDSARITVSAVGN